MGPDRDERVKAIGIWSASMSAGAAGGPIIGGLLIEAFSWQAVFLLNVPVVVVGIAAGFLLATALAEALTGSGRVDRTAVAGSTAPGVWPAAKSSSAAPTARAASSGAATRSSGIDSRPARTASTCG